MPHAERRPLQDVMDHESVKVLQHPLPKEWVLRPYHRDFGINYTIELFMNLFTADLNALSIAGGVPSVDSLNLFRGAG